MLVVRGKPHLARKTQARQITRRKGKYVSTEKREKHDSYGGRKHFSFLGLAEGWKRSATHAKGNNKTCVRN